MDKAQQVFEDFAVPDPVRIKKTAKFIHRHFKDIKSLTVLECGVTKGGLAEMLSKEGAQCFGVDIHPRSVDGVDIVQVDLNKGFPKFKTNFDIIFAGEVMEHLFDDVGFINDCRKLLKPGGLLILTVPNLVFSINRLLMLFGRTPLFAYAKYHYHMYTKKTLSKMITDGGFEILKFSSSHVLFSTRRNRLGKIFEMLGDIFPSFGAHLMIFAEKKES